MAAATSYRTVPRLLSLNIFDKGPLALLYAARFDITRFLGIPRVERADMILDCQRDWFSSHFIRWPYLPARLSAELATSRHPAPPALPARQSQPDRSAAAASVVLHSRRALRRIATGSHRFERFLLMPAITSQPYSAATTASRLAAIATVTARPTLKFRECPRAYGIRSARISLASTLFHRRPAIPPRSAYRRAISRRLLFAS